MDCFCRKCRNIGNLGIGTLSYHTGRVRELGVEWSKKEKRERAKFGYTNLFKCNKLDTVQKRHFIEQSNFYTTFDVTANLFKVQTGPLAWDSSAKLIPTCHKLVLLRYKLEWPQRIA